MQTAIPVLILALGVVWPPVAPSARDDPRAGPAVSSHAGQSLRVLTIETPPRLDGILDEPAWALAEPATDFVQRDPSEGMPATEPTEVRILSDGQNLYVGVMAYDSNPRGILARELRRDDDLQNDDTFALILDTFHDHRNGFVFRINPRGAQFDALITDEGRHVNETWREEWEVETHIGDDGWSAEIRIPLRSIRFAATDRRSVFGIDFERVIRRKNEFTYWANYSRDFHFYQVSQSGHLRGLGGLGANSRLRVKPYLNTRLSSRGGGEPRARLAADVGLENLKYSVTPGLTLDLTVNTDFAQTEVDDLVVNFDRVPLFFPERREFFLEGAGVFELGTVRGERSAEVRLYHSRRVGLSEAGRPIPLLAGAKLAGHVGEKVTLGLLNVQTGRQDGRAGDNFGVFRLRRNLLARSSAGVFLTTRQAADGRSSNRVTGFDSNLVLAGHLSVRSLLARSYTSGLPDAMLAAAGFQWDDDLRTAGFDYYRVGEAFRSDVGFLERIGVRKFGPHASISPRPRRGPIRQLNYGLRIDHFRRLADNTVETEVYHFNNGVHFHDGSRVRFNPHRRVEILRQPFPLPGGLIVPPGQYGWWYFPLTYDFNPARRLTGSLQYRTERNYFGDGGRRQLWSVNPVARLNQHVSARINYSLNRLQLPGGAPVNIHVANSRLDVSFTRAWLTSTVVQYSNSRDLMGVNFRLRYRYGAYHDLYVVLNSVRSGPFDLRESERSVTVKLTRAFDF